jgi:hypothetical protein
MMLKTNHTGNVIKIETMKGVFYNKPVDEAQWLLIEDAWLRALASGEQAAKAAHPAYINQVNAAKAIGKKLRTIPFVSPENIDGLQEVLEQIYADMNLLLQQESDTFAAYQKALRHWWKEKNQPEASPLIAHEYPIITTPEYDALEKAASDGKSGWGYSDNHQSLTRRHQRPDGLHHYVQLGLTEQEQQDGIGMDALAALTSDQDADCILALLCVTSALTQNVPFPSSGYAGGWIDIDDLIKKIGWTAQNAHHRQELRQKIYRYLQFGARAVVVGERTHI